LLKIDYDLQNIVPQLEKEKETLLNQLRDYEWRIEQETKVEQEIALPHPCFLL
jgi:hypothetical protein